MADVKLNEIEEDTYVMREDFGVGGSQLTLAFISKPHTALDQTARAVYSVKNNK